MHRFANYDPTVADPSPVTGWADNASAIYTHLPMPDAAPMVVDPDAPEVASASDQTGEAVVDAPVASLPAGWIEVDDDTWDKHIGDLRADAWHVIGGVVTWAEPPAVVLTPAQQAANAYAAFISAGLTVTSTGTPALDGVYSIDPTAQANISAEAQFITSFGEFTSGNTLQWQRADGSFTTFPDKTTFMDFAKIAAQTVSAAKLATGTTNALPSGSVTIL